jgi:SpoIIAA-like
MPATFQYDFATQLVELHINGILAREDMVAVENAMAGYIDAGDQPRVLVTLRNFGGWEKGGDWDNFDFMFSYGDKLAKIAIVGAGAKEAEVKAFTGAGLRPTPVCFFAESEAADARAWLLE